MNQLEPSAHSAHPHRWRVIALLLIVGLTPLLALPTADCGFGDDWSYAQMAFDVARTGTFHYDGWATAAVGPQAYWGALFVRMFGESHLALRCSTMILAAGAAVLLYGIGVLSRLSPASAFQAALAVMLCPVMFPLSASFMTDVPAVFVAMLALFLALATVRANDSRRQTLLLLGVVLIGWIGGQIRQPVWLIDLLIAPAVILIARPPRRIAIVWTVIVLVGIAAVFASLHRLQSQPLLISEDLGRSVIEALRQPQATSRRALHLFTTTVLLLTPMGLAFWPLLRRVSRSTLLLIVGLTLIEIVPLGLFRNVAYLTPWVGNTITDWGILPEQTDMLGSKPRIFPIALSAILLAWGLAWFNALLLTTILAHRAWFRAILYRLQHPQPIDLLLLYAAAVCGLSILRPLIVFDRYILPALPAAVIVLAQLRERYVAARSPRIVWMMLILWALFGWAITFDYHACLRARMIAMHELLQSGIPRNSVSAGLEPDGETQLRQVGHMNDARIATAGVYKPLILNPQWLAASYWLWPSTPAVEPRYVLSREPLRGYDETSFEPIAYWTSFPPFHRTIQMLRLDDSISTPHLVRRSD